MCVTTSWWAVQGSPAALITGFAFATAGMALPTFMRSRRDFGRSELTILPMFLFSATFFPIDAYPAALRWVIEVTPPYRGVALCRELTTGGLSMASVWSVVYLLVMGLVGLAVVSRRLDKLLLK